MTGANNTPGHRTLTDIEAAAAVSIKAKGEALLAEIKALDASGSREISIAATKAEEAVMWAMKHITKPKAQA